MNCNETLGTGNCAYNIMLPYYVRFMGDKPIEPEAKYVVIDKCVLREVLDLWEKGIKTTGCCCGHGKSDMAFIGVRREYIPKMKELGYKVYFNSCSPNDEDSFVPKTRMSYSDEINKGFNWWDETK